MIGTITSAYIRAWGRVHRDAPWPVAGMICNHLAPMRTPAPMAVAVDHSKSSHRQLWSPCAPGNTCDRFRSACQH